MTPVRKALSLKLVLPSLLLIGLLFWGCSTFSDYSQPSYERGQADALRDIKANVFATEVYGYGAMTSSEWNRELKARYNIEVHVVAGCIVNNRIIGHAKGYNEVSRKEIERRFGTNIWDKIDEEETAFYQSKAPLPGSTK